MGNLTIGLNAYDLFRTTYGGNAGSQKKAVTSRRLLEQSHKKSHSKGKSLVGDEIKHYQRGVKLDQYAPWIKSNPLLASAASEA